MHFLKRLKRRAIKRAEQEKADAALREKYLIAEFEDSFLIRMEDGSAVLVDKKIPNKPKKVE